MKNAAARIALPALVGLALALPLGGCGTVQGAVDSARQMAADAGVDVDAAIEGARETVGAVMEDVSGAVQSALEGIAGVPAEVERLFGELVGQDKLLEVEAFDAQTGDALATVTDNERIVADIEAFGFTSWSVAKEAPAGAKEEYRLVFKQDASALLGNKDGRKSELCTFTTYKGSSTVKLETAGITVTVYFELPQADADALRALAQ